MGVCVGAQIQGCGCVHVGLHVGVWVSMVVYVGGCWWVKVCLERGLVQLCTPRWTLGDLPPWLVTQFKKDRGAYFISGWRLPSSSFAALREHALQRGESKKCEDGANLSCQLLSAYARCSIRLGLLARESLFNPAPQVLHLEQDLPGIRPASPLNNGAVALAGITSLPVAHGQPLEQHDAHGQQGDEHGCPWNLN